MVTVQFDSTSKVIGDFKGVLTKAEEAVVTHKAAGKSCEAIAIIINKKPDTVKKQLKSSYKRTHVDGTDDPMQTLTLKAFKNGWLSFAMLVVLAVPQASSAFARLNTRISTARLRREEISYTITG